MNGATRRIRPLRCVGIAMVLFGLLVATGCQVDIGGQTHPSGYYLQDDIQYFPAGPEFKLAREAAAMEAAQQEQATQQY